MGGRAAAILVAPQRRSACHPPGPHIRARFGGARFSLRCSLGGESDGPARNSAPASRPGPFHISGSVDCSWAATGPGGSCDRVLLRMIRVVISDLARGRTGPAGILLKVGSGTFGDNRGNSFIGSNPRRYDEPTSWVEKTHPQKDSTTMGLYWHGRTIQPDLDGAPGAHPPVR